MLVSCYQYAQTRRTRYVRSARFAAAALLTASLAPGTPAQDTSPAPIVQWFDSTYQTQFDRTSDLFMAGYGGVWIPPTGRADSGNQSVGYDAYDRFDLGSWDNKTLYGTESGLRNVADRWHQAGVNVYADLIWNHNGFSDVGTPQFLEAGGYPGFVMQDPDYVGDPDGDVTNDPFGVPNTDGDFHGEFETGDLNGQLAGLIDIKHETTHFFIRTPVYEGDPLNIPRGTGVDLAGRTANVPTLANRRFYPDRNLDPIIVFNPDTGQGGIEIYPFNPGDPTAGDPVAENAIGILMRNAQWLIQDVGVDGFRLDAARHFEDFVMDYFDQAVYRSSTRTMLDGTPFHAFSFSEAASGDKDYVSRVHIEKSIDPNDIGKIGGNRDALDFNYFFAVRANLSSNGAGNDWRNVVGSDLDRFDDGLQNGSAGVKFVLSHDDPGAAMSNVSHALMLTLPGNANVYFNGEEHGDRDFPKDGRGDALGGVFGNSLTQLVGIRNSHGRGNYIERYLTKELYAYEREGSMVVLLNNRNDGGVDFVDRLNVNLPFGTPLIELTGNHAKDALVPELVVVTDDGPGTQTYIQGPRFLRNNGQDQGYLIYGLATPQSTNGVEVSNVAMVLEGGNPDPNGFSNGTTKLTDVHVIQNDSFTLKLATNPVNLLGFFRDRDADGDNALFRFDGGLDLNGNGAVDFVTPGSVAYGFEEFVTTKNPGYFDENGDGLFEQVIDASQLSEGEHYITVRAFRHRGDSGQPVYADFKKVIYVDRLAPESGVYGAKAVNAQGSGDRDVLFESLDLTANAMHVFLDLPETMSDADILQMALDGQGGAERVDIDLYKKFFGGLDAGNHVYTVVTFEQTGTSNVQRFTGNRIFDGPGGGFGDLDFDGSFDTTDLANSSFGFEAVLYSQNSVFNAAADLDGDGRVGWSDLIGLRDELADAGASQGVLDEYDQVLLRRGNVNQAFGTDSFDIDELVALIGTNDWHADIDSSGLVDEADKRLLVEVILGTSFGDANLDGNVSLADLDLLGQNFGGAGNWLGGDFNGDGFVTLADLDILGQNFGNGAAPLSRAEALQYIGVVPEPNSLALLGLGGLFLMRRRRWQ